MMLRMMSMISEFSQDQTSYIKVFGLYSIAMAVMSSKYGEEGDGPRRINNTYKFLWHTYRGYFNCEPITIQQYDPSDRHGRHEVASHSIIHGSSAEEQKVREEEINQRQVAFIYSSPRASEPTAARGIEVSIVVSKCIQ